MSKIEDTTLSQKFVNFLMINGKKNVATDIFCSAAHEFSVYLQKSGIHKGITEKVRGNLFDELRIAVENVQPSLECRRCKVGGTNHQVPAIVSQARATTLAVRWIIESARKRRKSSALSFSHCLARELLDAYQKQGRPRQKRDEYHKVSSGNRGYLRYRWW